jgi:hypothetical protein
MTAVTGKRRACGPPLQLSRESRCRLGQQTFIKWSPGNCARLLSYLKSSCIKSSSEN